MRSRYPCHRAKQDLAYDDASEARQQGLYGGCITVEGVSLSPVDFRAGLGIEGDVGRRQTRNR